MLSDIAAIFGIIGGVIAIGTLIYISGFWKRGVEDDILHIKKDNDEIKTELKAYNLPSFCMMVQTLWDVYVIDPLHRRPDIAEFHSLPKLTQKGLDYIPADVKKQLDRMAATAGDKVNVTSGYMAVQAIGLDKIMTIANEKGLSIQEIIAVLNTYLSSKKK